MAKKPQFKLRERSLKEAVKNARRIQNRDNAWAVILKPVDNPFCKSDGSYCFSWTEPHCEDPAPSCKVFAIYSKKKDAMADIRFRCSRGQAVVVKIKLPDIKL